MKVSPLETHNKYGVLVLEETKDNSSHPIDSMIVTFYAINFISKLRHHTHQCLHSKNSIPRKIPKTFIQSTHIEHEVRLKVGLRTVDTHVMVEVDVLLDCGATGLFINCMLVWNNGICMRKLEHLITVYNID